MTQLLVQNSINTLFSILFRLTVLFNPLFSQYGSPRLKSWTHFFLKMMTQYVMIQESVCMQNQTCKGILVTQNRSKHLLLNSKFISKLIWVVDSIGLDFISNVRYLGRRVFKWVNSVLKMSFGLCALFFLGPQIAIGTPYKQPWLLMSNQLNIHHKQTHTYCVLVRRWLRELCYGFELEAQWHPSFDNALSITTFR